MTVPVFVKIGKVNVNLSRVLWGIEDDDGYRFRMDTGDTSPAFEGVTAGAAQTTLEAAFQAARVQVTYQSPNPPPALP